MEFIKEPEIIYPESDGLPLADNTIQFRFITTIVGGIAAIYKDNPNVFVAGDLFWYPKEKHPEIRQAPDTMVVFGRPQGDRSSYKQWEEDNIPPQVVFEIASPRNTITELEVTRLEFYSEYGVEEYYVYYPESGRLKGWLRQGKMMNEIEEMEGWVSPKIGIRFEKIGKELQIYRPDGERICTYVEIMEEKKREATARQKAERERDLEATARQKAERERNLKAIPYLWQQEALPRLLSIGLTAEQISYGLSLPLEIVQKFIDTNI
ncbi:MAG: Uma2 family endonuclease [Okeania sp. SIO3I5]|uniref:Uma2 family endonuclease n=1 Tax=Okeania sp. SIO3I5 TaxID=2607805 RepID=UPI0013BD4CAC|nr:Uma2 family endonuclease [Okeania sp. SIO3I5]NEQ41010.1 Uma2 family endonuclease [Okeania sp. SIO3I5]